MFFQFNSFFYLIYRWRFCSRCEKTGSNTLDPLAWSDSHYLDEITAGTFLLKQYNFTYFF